MVRSPWTAAEHNLPCYELCPIPRGSLSSWWQQRAGWYMPGGYIVPLIFPILILSLLSPCLVRMSFCVCFTGTIYCSFRLDSWSVGRSQCCFLFILGPSLSEDFGESSLWAHSHGLGEHLGEAQKCHEVSQSPCSPCVTDDMLSLSSP